MIELKKIFEILWKNITKWAQSSREPIVNVLYFPTDIEQAGHLVSNEDFSGLNFPQLR